MSGVQCPANPRSSTVQAFRDEAAAIQRTLLDTSGVQGVHDIRTRKMGEMIVVDAHLEIDAGLTVDEGHKIAVQARQRVMQRHRVLNVMTHVDPWRPPDAPMQGAEGRANLEPGCP